MLSIIVCISFLRSLLISAVNSSFNRGQISRNPSDIRIPTTLRQYNRTQTQNNSKPVETTATATKTNTALTQHKKEPETETFRVKEDFRVPPPAEEEVGGAGEEEMALHTANKYEMCELDVIFTAARSCQRRRRGGGRRQQYRKSEKFPKKHCSKFRVALSCD